MGSPTISLILLEYLKQRKYIKENEVF